MKLCLGASLLAVGVSMIACSDKPADDTPDDEVIGTDGAELGVSSSFVSRGTGYYPSSSALEGGFVDRKGAPLRTLQAFLAGRATYVSVAMDVNAFRYGQRLRIRELETKYGRSIVFRVVDTGGAFRNKGRTRIDICTANASASVDATINRALHIDVIDESAPSTPTEEEPDTSGPANPAGSACSNDGQCNPGSDGSGKICKSSHCVAGCRTNAQCPGSTHCVSGQCN